MQHFNSATREEIIFNMARAIITIKNIDAKGTDLLPIFGTYSDKTNFDAIYRFVADHLDELNERNPSEYYINHFDDLVDRIRLKIGGF